MLERPPSSSAKGESNLFVRCLYDSINPPALTLRLSRKKLEKILFAFAFHRFSSLNEPADDGRRSRRKSFSRNLSIVFSLPQLSSCESFLRGRYGGGVTRRD
jgi:hypothetical protein